MRQDYDSSQLITEIYSFVSLDRRQYTQSRLGLPHGPGTEGSREPFSSSSETRKVVSRRFGVEPSPSLVSFTLPLSRTILLKKNFQIGE